MKQIVIFPKGCFEAKDKRRMQRAGYLAIEAHNPEKVIMLMPVGNVTGDMLSMAAMDAMAGTEYGKEAIRARFAANLHARLKQREENQCRK